MDLSPAISRLRVGRGVVIVDDPARKHEGAIVVAAEHVTAATVSFMATHARGLVSLCLPPERCEELGLPPMIYESEARFGTDFMMTFEARRGVSTGISAADRAHSIAVATDDDCRPSDIVRPGHVIVLRARAGGVLERPGHTEAAVDLVRLAGLKPAAVICKVMNDDGTMARTGDLVRYCARHRMPLVRVADLLAHDDRLMIRGRGGAALCI